MTLQWIDSENRLYVMPAGKGYSCYGFDVLDLKARKVAAWMDLSFTDWPKPGTTDHFARCAVVMATGENHARATGTRCDAELCPELIGLEGQRIACTMYGKRVRFRVGKSSGWMPCHLLLHNTRSHGGPAISLGSVSNVKVVK